MGAILARLLLLSLVVWALAVPAWTTPAFRESLTEEEWQYIPSDLEDALRHLQKCLHPLALQEMEQGTEDDMVRYHLGFGMTLRNEWGLWKGSRLSRWFNEQGIHHPDDMSGIILTSLWRRLHGQPLGLDEQIAFYQEYWRRAEERARRERLGMERGSRPSASAVSAPCPKEAASLWGGPGSTASLEAGSSRSSASTM